MKALSFGLRVLAKMPGFRRLWRQIPVGTCKRLTEYDIWDRPNYGFGINSAALLAKSLGLPAISVVEFGVANGTGLRSMERIAKRISKGLGVTIDVYGFDTGQGMPPPVDYRDLPNVWETGIFKMDVDKLRSELNGAQLVLGDVSRTIPEFLSSTSHAPIGFVSFDLDYYSSTMQAFEIFSGTAASRLPRVFCYFDDIISPERACLNDFVGELCAIREFNEQYDRRKIAKFPYLSWLRAVAAQWNDQIYVFHDFEHPLYTQMLTREFHQLPRV